MNDDRPSSLLPFIAGLAAGALLGVLFAPAAGEETRRKLRTKGMAAKEDIQHLFEDGHQAWSKAKGKATDAASMTRDEVKDFLSFLMSEGKDLVSRVKEDANEQA